jgi:multicomponent Na+:H+ antiporter subunit E
VTIRETVAHVVRQASDALDDGQTVELHFVSISIMGATDEETDADAEELRELIDAWVTEDFGEEIPASVTVETAIVGQDQYLFSPDDYADVLLDYASANGLGRVVMDPEYNPEGTIPLLAPIQSRLRQSDLDVEEAPVERPSRQPVLARAASLPKYFAVFAVSFGFYLLLGSLSAFDLLTGAVSATLASVLLTPVAFRRNPSFGSVAKPLVRLPIYAVYLLWEIAKANVTMAYVILHPSLPIDPKLVEVQSALWGDIPITTLANSITLTPGTLTVTVSQRNFLVHSLTGSARDDLSAGGLERAVRFVFYGRSGARIPSPRERGDYNEDYIFETDEPINDHDENMTHDHDDTEVEPDG